jgi:hypothetical protein
MVIMTYRHRVNLSQEDALALSAATAPVEIARRSWIELMRSLPFDEVNDNTQRAMPAIFCNLRNEQGLPERDRMRGAFKYAWSKNTGMFHDLRPVLNQLNSEEIDFRVIKGAAVQTLTNRIGARTMGDIDLLIRSSDSGRVERIFLDNGFRANSRSTCTGHESTDHFDSQNFNIGSTHVDVHVAEAKEPVSLFTEMLTRRPMRVVAGGCELQVPEVELLVLHAAVHGDVSSGKTDLMQAALDFALLEPQISQDLLLGLAKKTKTLQPLERLSAALKSIHLDIAQIEVPRGKLLLEKLKNHFAQLRNSVVEMNSLLRRIQARRRSKDVMREISAHFRGRRRTYHAWINWGRFAATERMAVRLWGGFLPKPRSVWLGDVTLQPFEIDAIEVSASNVAARAQDWRFRIELPQQFDILWIRVDSEAFDWLDAFVFCNGIPTTRISANDEKSKLIGIRNVGPSLEMSLRPLWSVCESCYSGFPDLVVSMISTTPGIR